MKGDNDILKMLSEAGIQLSGGRSFQPAFATVKALMGKQSENDYKRPALKPFKYSAVDNPSEFIQRKFGDSKEIKPFDRCAPCRREKREKSPEEQLWEAVHTPEYWGLRYSDMKQDGRWWYTDDGYRYPPIVWVDPKTGKKYWAIAVMGDGWMDTTKLGKDRKKNRYEYLAFREDNAPNLDDLERFKGEEQRTTIDRVVLNDVRLVITNLTLARAPKEKKKKEGTVVVPKKIEKVLEEVKEVRKEEREERKEPKKVKIKEETKEEEEEPDFKLPEKPDTLTKDQRDFYTEHAKELHKTLTKERLRLDELIDKFQSATSEGDLLSKLRLRSMFDFTIVLGNLESRLVSTLSQLYEAERILDPPDTELERVNSDIDKIKDEIIIYDKVYEEILKHKNSKWIEGIERRRRANREYIQESEDEIKPLELLRDSLDITIKKAPFTVSPPKEKIEEVERIYPESDGFTCPIDKKQFLAENSLRIHLRDRHPTVKFIFEKGERPDDD